MTQEEENFAKTFARFIEYQKIISERADLIGAGSHVVDVVRVPE